MTAEVCTECGHALPPLTIVEDGPNRLCPRCATLTIQSLRGTLVAAQHEAAEERKKLAEALRERHAATLVSALGGKVYRSADNGATWAEVYDSTETRIYSDAPGRQKT